MNVLVFIDIYLLAEVAQQFSSLLGETTRNIEWSRSDLYVEIYLKEN